VLPIEYLAKGPAQKEIIEVVLLAIHRRQKKCKMLLGRVMLSSSPVMICRESDPQMPNSNGSMHWAARGANRATSSTMTGAKQDSRAAMPVT
jgi:hypothetical protein